MSDVLAEFLNEVSETGGQPVKKSYMLVFGDTTIASGVAKLIREMGVECYINNLLNDSKTVYIPRKEVSYISLLDGFQFEEPEIKFDWKIGLRL
jgi:hypothetical protein